MRPPLAGFWLLLLWSSTCGAQEGETPLPDSIHFISAVCTRFRWVSDLPLATNTVVLLDRTVRILDPEAVVEAWNDGTASEFLRWTEGRRLSARKKWLVFYFSSHQKTDGRIKFSEGDDLPPEKLVAAVNEMGRDSERVLFINDSCYAASLEKTGGFASNVMRCYSSREEEEAVDVEFDKGPAGVEEFMQPERAGLRVNWGWDPPGMSFLGIAGLKAGWGKRLRTCDAFWRELLRAREAYHDSVRPGRVQHFVLVPAL